MSVVLTERQQQILTWIGEYTALNRFPPARSEIAKAFGFSSINGAEQHVRALEAKGALKIVPGVSRGLVLPEASAPAKKRRD